MSERCDGFKSRMKRTIRRGATKPFPNGKCLSRILGLTPRRATNPFPGDWGVWQKPGPLFRGLRLPSVGPEPPPLSQISWEPAGQTEFSASWVESTIALFNLRCRQPVRPTPVPAAGGKRANREMSTVKFERDCAY